MATFQPWSAATGAPSSSPCCSGCGGGAARGVLAPHREGRRSPHASTTLRQRRWQRRRQRQQHRQMRNTHRHHLQAADPRFSRIARASHSPLLLRLVREAAQMETSELVPGGGGGGYGLDFPEDRVPFSTLPLIASPEAELRFPDLPCREQPRQPGAGTATGLGPAVPTSRGPDSGTPCSAPPPPPYSESGDLGFPNAVFHHPLVAVELRFPHPRLIGFLSNPEVVPIVSIWMASLMRMPTVKRVAGPRAAAPQAGRRPRGRRQAARQRRDEREVRVLGGGGGGVHPPSGDSSACERSAAVMMGMRAPPPPVPRVQRQSNAASAPCVPLSAAGKASPGR